MDDIRSTKKTSATESRASMFASTYRRSAGPTLCAHDQLAMPFGVTLAV
jgi:hypothetical protein